LKIETSELEGIGIIELKGRLMGGPDAGALRSAVDRFIQEGIKKFVIDLGRVNWINSTGMGILLTEHSRVRKLGGDLKLSNVSSRIRSILYVTKMTLIFECFDDIESAVESFYFD